MSRIFISHASRDNHEALAVRDWLIGQGWTAEDIFLDLSNIDAGERWKDALSQANARCEAVLFLASTASIASPECLAEIRTAENFGKEVIVALLEGVAIQDGRLASFLDRQIVDLAAAPRELAVEVSHRDQHKLVELNAQSLSRIRRRLEELGIAPERFAWNPGADLDHASPYPGLAGYGEADAGIFFGRGGDIARGLAEIRRLRRRGTGALLYIQAASGAGKSSFLKAGLWPRLKRDADYVPLVILRPAAGIIGSETGLARGLANWLSGHGVPTSSGQIAARLEREGADALVNLLDQIAEIAHGERRLSDPSAARPQPILAIDQAEELLGPEAEIESQRFLRLLAQLLDVHSAEAGGSRIPPIVVATLRADSMDPMLQAARAEGLGNLESFLLPPIRRDLYREVVLRPAEAARSAGLMISIEDTLADAIVQDAEGADALPLMAFALRELLQDNRIGRRAGLKLDHYLAMGGIGGALAKRLKAAQRATATSAFGDALRALILPALATWDTEASPPGAKRRIAEEASLFEGERTALRPLAQTLVEERLLTRGASTLEVAHEALLRQPPISLWLEADAEFLAWRDQASRAMRQEHAGERGLLFERELAIAAVWLETRRSDIGAELSGFVQRSLDAEAAREEQELARQRELEAARIEAAEQQAEAQRVRAEIQIRSNRRLRATVAFLVVALVAAMVGSAWYWNEFIRPQHRDYAGFTTRWDLPSGVSALSEERVRGAAASYRIERRGRAGPALSIERRSGDGSCVPFDPGDTIASLSVEEEGRAATICRIEYQTNQDGHILTERFRGVDGRIIGSLIFAPAQDRTGQPAYFAGEDGSPRSLEGTAVARVQISFSAEGAQQRVMLFGPDGSPRPGARGAFGFSDERDGQGRLLRRVGLDAAAAPMRGRTGWAELRRSYTTGGELVGESYHEVDGTPTTTEIGVYRVAFERDGRGNLSARLAFGLEGAPVQDRSGCHRQIWVFNEQGQRQESACFDEAGAKTTFYKTGYHRLTEARTPDAVTTDYIDAEGRPALQMGHYSRMVERRNARGQLLETAYLDAAGTAVFGPGRCARRTLQYEEAGLLTAEACFGADGKPFRDQASVHEIRYGYDSTGNLVDTRYFGSDGNPQLNPQGWWRERREIGGRGEVLGRSYFDTADAPTLTRFRYHRVRYTYDAAGQEVATAYFERDGKPTVSDRGYHIINRRHDARGFETETSYFAVNGAPTETRRGIHRELRRRDALGHAVSEEFRYANGNLVEVIVNLRGVNEDDGVARIDTDYNRFGRPERKRFFRINGARLSDQLTGATTQQTSSSEFEPALLRASSEAMHAASEIAFHYDRWGELAGERFDQLVDQGDKSGPNTGLLNVINERDRFGRIVEEIFMDAANPFQRLWRRENNYGPEGSVSSWALFGPLNEPIADAQGVHRTEMSRDDHGRIVEERVFDTAGAPILADGAYHIKRFRYDENGFQVSERAFNLNGEPSRLVARYMGHGRIRTNNRFGDRLTERLEDVSGKFLRFGDGPAITAYEYDDRQNLSRTRFLDEAGSPMNARNGHHAIENRYDDADREISVSYWNVAQQPVLGPDHYHRRDQDYDEVGDVLRIAFLGPVEDPICGRTDNDPVGMDYHIRERAFPTGVRFFDALGRDYTQDQLYDAVSRHLAMRPPPNRFRDQLFWLVDLVYKTKNTQNPVFRRMAIAAESAIGQLGNLSKSGDQTGLEDVTYRVQNFSAYLRRALGERFGGLQSAGAASRCADSLPVFVPQLGVSLRTIQNSEVAARLGLGAGGVIISAAPVGQALAAGLQAGDIVWTVNDRRVQTGPAVQYAVHAGRGARVRLGIIRRGAALTVELNPEEQAPAGAKANPILPEAAIDRSVVPLLTGFGFATESITRDGQVYRRIARIARQPTIEGKSEPALLAPGDLLISASTLANDPLTMLLFVIRDSGATYIPLKLRDFYSEVDASYHKAAEEKKWPETLELLRWLVVAQPAFSIAAGEDVASRLEAASNLANSLGYALLFNGGFAESEAVLRAAVKQASPDMRLFMEGNLGLALLFQKRMPEALSLLRRPKGTMLGTRPWDVPLLEDLALLKEAGITSPEAEALADELTKRQ